MISNSTEREIGRQVIQMIGELCNPEEVFSYEQLETWASENGFKKEDE